jgi:hypothetical protein
MIICTFKRQMKMVDAARYAERMGCVLQWAIIDGKVKLGMVRK